jgi:hypothetical protein
VTVSGGVVALLWAIHPTRNSTLYAPLKWLGECSLLMYIFHLAIIIHLLQPLFPDRQLPTFIVINFATVGGLTVTALVVRKLKSVQDDRSYFARFLSVVDTKASLACA